VGKACKSIVVERDYVCKDYSDTYVHFYAKKFASYPKKCFRLLFFRETVRSIDWRNVRDYAGSFIGYSVVRPTWIRSIGRTVLDPRYCDGVDGFMCVGRHHVHFLGDTFTVHGFPYISQDGDVTICAHAASWMCFRHFSELQPKYREIYPYQITQLTTDLSRGRLTPSDGTTIGQIVEMFSRFGFFPMVYFRDTYAHKPGLFERLLYYHVESGLPPVLGVEGHAVVAIGHTSDFEIRLATRKPKDQPWYSSMFVTSFVINDDRRRPYEKMRVDERVSISGNLSKLTLGNVQSFVVPLPEKAHLPAEDVELKTVTLLRDGPISLEALSQNLSFKDVVLRICLTSSEAYKQHLVTSPLPHELNDIYLNLPMPHYIWLAELSTRELSREHKALGEIIWDATGVREEAFPWIVVHYPDVLLVNDRSHVHTLPPQLALEGRSEYPVFQGSNLTAIGSAVKQGAGKYGTA
jgi:hypothetical protein